ncbi:DUF2809 domain-containing protein [Lacinutrix iliipiscaria]|uniref:DUF2809 domain-containing protein n=1 Tax=Lacinutrix iliipiscaria TaxID=1230532 RepID=A0ABW5WPE5_9FLAO
MKFKFNKNSLLVAAILGLTEIAIATFLKTGFIRHTFGDYLVVILLYYSFKSFIKTKPIYLASVVLTIAFIIEFLQLVNLLNYLNLQNSTLAKLVLGSTFQIGDLIAYKLGVFSILIYEYKIKQHDEFKIRNC